MDLKVEEMIFLLIEGFGNITYETGIQKDKTILPGKPFQTEKNISEQEKVLGIGFLNAPTGNISYGMSAKYAEDSTPDNPIISKTELAFNDWTNEKTIF